MSSLNHVRRSRRTYEEPVTHSNDARRYSKSAGPAGSEHSAWQCRKRKDAVYEVRLLRMPRPGGSGRGGHRPAAQSKPHYVRTIRFLHPETIGRDAALHGESGE